MEVRQHIGCFEPLLTQHRGRRESVKMVMQMSVVQSHKGSFLRNLAAACFLFSPMPAIRRAVWLTSVPVPSSCLLSRRAR